MISRRIFLGGLVVVALLSAASKPLAHGPAHRGTPPLTRQAIYRQAPRFTLITQDGERLALRDLGGKVVLVNFIYTSCPDVCPIATAKFLRLQHLLQTQGLQGHISFLSITTDPAIDAPSVLKAYGRRYGADFSNWTFLTGGPEEITQVWEAFGVVAVSRARGDIDHSSMAFLLDRTGRIRLIYRGYGWDEEDVAAQVATLLEEG
ncbi:MAG: SCO family protein [Candidatus Methylomirabilales bacterium]